MTVPKGVPPLIRAGTGPGCPGQFDNSLLRASLGCKGHSFASLLDPLPFPLSRPSARFRLAGPGRSLSLTKGQGQGLRPLHPARCGSPTAAAVESWPLSTNPSSAATQGGVADDFLECLARGAFISFPTPRMENTARSSDIIAEAVQGCLRFRVYEYETIDGKTLHGVEISAWNGWAGQFKLLFFEGGVNCHEALAGMKQLRKMLVDYDWMSGDYVFAR